MAEKLQLNLVAASFILMFWMPLRSIMIQR